MKRVCLYIEEEEYLKLRSLLVLDRLTVSEWMRQRVRSYIDRKTKIREELDDRGLR